MRGCIDCIMDMHHKKKAEGIVVLTKKKNAFDFDDLSSSIKDGFDEFVGKKISFQLVSAVNTDSENKLKGKLGKPSFLGKQLKSSAALSLGDAAFTVTFNWDEQIDLPGALIVRNEHRSEFYLKTVTVNDCPNHGKVHFVCNSWVYPAQKDRIFFSNQVYLPHQTPEPLRKYREEELSTLRGTGEGMLKEWDRVYDYAYYNDLGEPDKNAEKIRPVLGGSSEYPYPRRVRTGRPPTKKDPNTESRLSLAKGIHLYMPRDERWSHIKTADFFGDSIKSLSQVAAGLVGGLFDKTPLNFDSFEEVQKMYEGGIKLPKFQLIEKIQEHIPSEFFKRLFDQGDGAPILKFPMPGIIKEDKSAWSTDEEFAREMLAGIHPLIIRRLEEFPPASKLDLVKYGDQNSSISRECIEGNLDGLTVDKALETNRLFILDHHDTMIPYLRKIHRDTPSRVYATRTIVFLKDDGTLKPLAIELSLPHPEGDQYGAVSKVYKPATDGLEGSLWQLAKAYVAVSDASYHQLISHWLHTHAVTEPFIIATHRQLSVLHPIYKLLHPHFRDTMHINAIGRQVALNADGLFEASVFTKQYSGEWSSKLYKDWVFPDQAVPRDLVKRGMAVKDPDSPNGYKLVIEDYPYAIDALEIWSVIESWVRDYCSFYYDSNETIVKDVELQAWWKEIREVGHGDLKDKDWWPKMTTFEELVQSCTTIIWVASALHAAVNFGQYDYAGYVPNRPTISRQFIPEPNTPEYEELKINPDKVFFKTITSLAQTMVGVSLIELLSRHSSDEVYLGERDDFIEWTSDSAPLDAFDKFGKKLKEIEAKMLERNNNPKWKNRVGPAMLPYTLLVPSSDAGITGRGIPNSIST